MQTTSKPLNNKPKARNRIVNKSSCRGLKSIPSTWLKYE